LGFFFCLCPNNGFAILRGSSRSMVDGSVFSDEATSGAVVS
jgi:hypothetical protein